jgi:hypothetical protein
MTRPMITCPTFARIDVVLCEDDRSKLAYCYPNHDDDEGLVTLNLEDLPPEAFPLPRLEDDDDDGWG